MNKKIAITSILTVLFLISISMASAINTTDIKNEKEESPLYNYRTNRAIQQKIQNIKTKFFGNRLFFLPFQFIKIPEKILRDELNDKDTYDLINCFTYHIETIFCGHCTQGIICDP